MAWQDARSSPCIWGSFVFGEWRCGKWSVSIHLFLALKVVLMLKCMQGLVILLHHADSRPANILGSQASTGRLLVTARLVDIVPQCVEHLLVHGMVTIAIVLDAS